MSGSFGSNGWVMTAVALALAAPTAVWAQAAADNEGGIAEIVVTAQKREESAQKVPISIQALSSTQLRQMGISNTNDLPLAVPGFQISSSAANQLYYLRGVGSQQVSTGTTAEVATFVDGVYMPFPSSALQGFGDIESLEVDKGPQGTLFGRNATGGVIQFRTKDPKFDLGGEFSASYGNYQHAVGSVYLTGPITDKLAASIAAITDDQMDGYGKSQATGKDAHKRSIYAVRGKLLFNLSDATQIRIGADFSRVRGDAGGTIRPAKGVQLWNQVTNTQQIIPGFYDTNQDSSAFHTVKDYGGFVRLDSDFGWANFLSISAVRWNKNTTNVDFDGGPDRFLPVIVISSDRVITQELQLSSPSDSKLVWTVGGFFLRQSGDTAPFQFGAPFPTFALPFGVPLGDAYQVYSQPTATSFAGFAQATATVLPDTHLTLGARYTHDTKKINGFGQVSGPSTNPPRVLPFTVGSQTAKYGKPTWRIALDHDVTETVKVYASYNRGFQAGTFNANNASGFTAAANPPLDPEKIDAYEVGLKSDLFDRHFRANLAAFWYDYANLQQQTYVNGQLRTLNAGAARIKGIDFEFIYQPVKSLSIGFVGEVLDAKFTDFANAPGYTYPQGFGVGPLVPTPIPNAKGNYLSFAPKFTSTAYVNHMLETSVGMFTTNANLVYNDGYYVEPGNLYKEPHFYVVNLTEEWAPNENLSLSLWIKNLFDRKYDQSVAAVGTVGFAGNTVGAPREYGFTARYRF
ncbi:TonB-dependent receptor [Rhizorhabdus wittichii]|uniref:TonB-dependent receptor n=1 Tax=Rhizorhabdus wittichii TaxID=160791 RepID=A0A975D2J3_9SPHN|nr:TonB-dependent receptor [Rhizorhabdus wittichii]QTH21699.1 TonB-dependent receptor [Rhizorhabdus wittichii]